MGEVIAPRIAGYNTYLSSEHMFLQAPRKPQTKSTIQTAKSHAATMEKNALIHLEFFFVSDFIISILQ